MPPIDDYPERLCGIGGPLIYGQPLQTKMNRMKLPFGVRALFLSISGEI
jgi:hypothetical protein